MIQNDSAAFPIPSPFVEGGISVREYIAIEAMKALIPRYLLIDMRLVPEQACTIADMMVAEMNKRFYDE